MSRLLIIPAAGLGTRLGSPLPKLLVPVAGVTMLDRLLDLYESVVDRVVLVVNPSAAPGVDQHLRSRTRRLPVECVQQTSPTGMLDAILLGVPAVAVYEPSSVWVTWCDQVAVHPKTIARLAERTSGASAALVMPTVRCEHPYIHLERDGSNRIVRVRHRREGDAMPDAGESDMGLFAMSRVAYLEWLPKYLAEAEVGRQTGERNFLPFIVWVDRHAKVETFPCEDPMEAIGINTPDDLARVERYLTR
ncbi:MAG: hypothetical protein EPO35_04270 [Acidobacteria bacterium]|nr:MAG: hypothetical protein EPO35_04270 [Acidobacteriota bacterium]